MTPTKPYLCKTPSAHWQVPAISPADLLSIGVFESMPKAIVNVANLKDFPDHWNADNIGREAIAGISANPTNALATKINPGGPCRIKAWVLVLSSIKIIIMGIEPRQWSWKGLNTKQDR